MGITTQLQHTTKPQLGAGREEKMGISVPLVDNFQSWFKKKDERRIDNYLFRLHHQVSFAIILFGVLFTFGLNYLDGTSITCSEGTPSIAVKSCWIHGGGHVSEALAKQGVSKCIATEPTEEGSTAYYVWVPFILVACMGLAKLPRTIWKILEGGLMENLLDSKSEKIVENLLRQKHRKSFFGRHKFFFYHWAYAFCEVLNILCVFASMAILDALFKAKFWNYGSDVYSHAMYSDPENNDGADSYPNAKCNLFPTEISCHFKKGGIAGPADVTNHLCILSNNLFNQYYFAILWFWWVFLLIISCFAVVYRISRLFVPAFNEWVVQVLVNKDVDGTNLNSWELFMLGRISHNVSSTTMKEMLAELWRNEEPLKMEEKPLVNVDSELA